MINFNANASKDANRKKKSMVLVGILAIVLLITGTFAWRDYNQHKTNRLQGVKEKYGVSLNDSFNPNDYLNWKEGETAKKIVNVSNEGDGDVYIRLKIGEYVGVGNAKYKNSEHRYLVNEKGSFISVRNVSGDTSITNAELTDLWNRYTHVNTGLKPENQTIKSKEALAAKEIDSVKDMFSGDEFWYIRTDHTNSNGIYGKHVPIGLETQDMESIIENKVAPTEADLDDGHHETFEEFSCEDTYTTYDFSGTDVDSEKIRNHFEIQKLQSDGVGKTLENGTFADVRLMSELISDDNWATDIDEDNPFWILDDRQDGGNWIYWSVPLKKNGVTTNIMDQLDYVSEVLTGNQEAFEYYVHIDMQALSKNELVIEGTNTWSEMPQSFLDEWTN